MVAGGFADVASVNDPLEETPADRSFCPSFQKMKLSKNESMREFYHVSNIKLVWQSNAIKMVYSLCEKLECLSSPNYD